MSTSWAPWTAISERTAALHSGRSKPLSHPFSPGGLFYLGQCSPACGGWTQKPQHDTSLSSDVASKWISGTPMPSNDIKMTANPDLFPSTFRKLLLDIFWLSRRVFYITFASLHCHVLVEKSQRAFSLNIVFSKSMTLDKWVKIQVFSTF